MGPKGWRGEGNGFGRRLSFAHGFGQLFPASRNDFIQVFGQIFGIDITRAHVLQCAEKGSFLLVFFCL